MRPLRRTLQAAALAAALVLSLAPVAPAASTTRYTTYSFAERANPGLEASGTLSEFRAVTGARVIVRADWQRLSAPAGQLRFLSGANPSCRYVVTFSARSLLAGSAAAEDYVAKAMPSPGRGRLLDRGVRGGAAWRVTRPSSIGERVRLRSVRASILTRRTDVAPSGPVAWSELRVAATSRAGDECHAGTWRDGLGPQLGDILATAKTSLKFVRES